MRFGTDNDSGKSQPQNWLTPNKIENPAIIAHLLGGFFVREGEEGNVLLGIGIDISLSWAALRGIEHYPSPYYEHSLTVKQIKNE